MAARRCGAYPPTAGDCEDIALLKRRDLIEKGWPVGALLMTVVRQANGEGHAVLTVLTDRGDLVLDNLKSSDPGVERDALPVRQTAIGVQQRPVGRDQ